MKTRTVYIGLKIRNGLIGFLLIVPKMFGLSVNFMAGFRHYRRQNNNSGSSATKLTFVVSVLIANLLKLHAKLQNKQRRRSIRRSPRSPPAMLPPSIKCHD